MVVMYCVLFYRIKTTGLLRQKTLVYAHTLELYMVFIRDTEVDDIPRMQHILEKSIQQRGKDAYTEDQVDALSQSYADIFHGNISDTSSQNIVAIDDSSVVGFGGVDYEKGRILNLYVHPDAADNGVGTQILSRLEARADQPNYNSIGVFASLNAVGFYEKFGYRKRFNCDVETPDGRLAPVVYMVHSIED